MIESWWFVLAMIAVLMIPGPTNALLASSAHQQGIAKTSMLIPAELFGYAYAISLWALLIHLSAPIWPYFIDILPFLAQPIKREYLLGKTKVSLFFKYSMIFTFI